MGRRWTIVLSLLLALVLAAGTASAAAPAASPNPSLGDFVIVLHEPFPGDPGSAIDDQMVLADFLALLQARGTIGSYTAYFGANATVVTGGALVRPFLETWPTVAQIQAYQPGAFEEVAGHGASPDATGQITGQVTGPDGTTPLSGITVTAYRQTSPTTWAVAGNTSSAGDGSYTVGSLASGVYRAKFTDPAGNYVEEFYNDKPDFNSATSFNVTDGATTSNINASMALAGKISGTVTDGGDGSPVEDITVGAYRFSGGIWTLVKSTLTASNGTYTLGGLAAGTYRVKFSDLFLRYDEEWYFNAPTVDLATDIALAAGSTQSGVYAALEGAGSLQGTVTGPDAVTPAAGIDVDILQYNPMGYWQWVGGATTAGDGTYSVTVLAGTYRVGFVDPLDYFAAEYYDDSPTADAGDDVVVQQGSTTTGIDASLALVALPVAPVVDIGASGTNAVLTWPAVSQDTAGKPITVQRYEVWRSSQPYLAPGDPGATRFDRTDLTFTDDVLTSENGLYYVVRVLSGQGGYSAPSNRVGKLTYGLVPGS